MTHLFKIDGRPGTFTPAQMLALREGWAQDMRGWFRAPKPGFRQVVHGGRESPMVECLEDTEVLEALVDVLAWLAATPEGHETVPPDSVARARAAVAKVTGSAA